MRSLVTIDVEGTVATSTSPSNSFESVDVLDDLLDGLDVPATLFVTPAVVEARPRLVEKWIDFGMHVGLHVHPAQMSGGDSDWLTDYGADEVRGFVASGCRTFEDTIGYRPTSFRAGRWEYSDELLEVLGTTGFRYDASLKPDRPTAPYESFGVKELPLTVYGPRLVRFLCNFYSFDSVPLAADAFLRNRAIGVAFYALTWRLLHSSSQYLMVSLHDYDILDPDVRERVRRYVRFLAVRSDLATSESL